LKFKKFILKGAEINNLLKCVLNKLPDKLDCSNRESKALKFYAKLTNSLNPKLKYVYIKPMRLSKFTLKETKKFGFECSNRLWKSCLRIGPDNKDGRKPIGDTIKKSINTFMKGFSAPSSDRFFTF